ncbi:MAG: hypothetical protein RJB03_742 [Bacteroidota bacterium]
MKHYTFLSLLFFHSFLLEAQDEKVLKTPQSPKAKDTNLVVLEPVVVRGFESNVLLQKTPATIGVISANGIRPMNGTSTLGLLPAFNQLSGVRFEERSPGSVRLSIRGSLLRSPFGVRNVKMYLDEFIFSDAGGNSYLNLLDINSVGTAEVLKGPAGSLYGAGTGGAVLLGTAKILSDKTVDSSAWKLVMNGGRFGSFNEALHYQYNGKDAKIQVLQGHAQSDGYRDQTKMRKDNLMMRLGFKNSDKFSTDFLLLLTDLYYQTPGGLTLSQFESNPRQSRPATAVLPSFKDQKTAVYNKTAVLGIANTVQLSKSWKTVTAISSSITGFKNPFLTNYEKRSELNVGLRSKWVYEKNIGIPIQWVSGIELQTGDYSIDSSGNNKGVPDANKVTDNIIARQQFLFSQVQVSPFSFMRFQTGFSYNNFRYSIERTLGIPNNGMIDMNFKGQLLPRFSLMINPIEPLGFYAVISKGYSSPTIAEIRPSAGGIYKELQAEYGWNKEWGVKFSALRSRFSLELVHFQFDLKDAIVRQVNARGAEYFINTGSTQQKGWETDISMLILNRQPGNGLYRMTASAAYSKNSFRFLEYKPSGANFSGNKLTGVPSEVVSMGVQFSFLKRFFCNLNFYYAGAIPLNDANTAFAQPYRLWQGKLGWEGKMAKKKCSIYLVADNIFNERYGLGNDINAFGGRFYNAAPSRTLQAGFSLQL